MNLNLKANFFLAQAFAKAALAAGRGGRIVNIASLLSFQGGIRVASYTASKSGLAGLTRLLACEWAAKGINVNAIAPGYVESNNTQALRRSRAQRRNSRPDSGRALGQALDIGGAAVFWRATPLPTSTARSFLSTEAGWHDDRPSQRLFPA